VIVGLAALFAFARREHIQVQLPETTSVSPAQRKSC